jgi:hypothetical protein
MFFVLLQGLINGLAHTGVCGFWNSLALKGFFESLEGSGTLALEQAFVLNLHGIEVRLKKRINVILR